MIVTIYALIDPRSEEIRYVGQTSKEPKDRLLWHTYRSNRNCHKDRWVRQLRRANLAPRMIIVQRVPKSCWKEAERYWIKFFRERGCPLTNSTDGGDGLAGYRASAETRAKMRAAWTRRARPLKRRPHTEETREKLRQATLKQFENPEARAAVGEVHKGKQISAEHRAIVSAATTKRWTEWRASGAKTSEETRAKISAAKTGKPLSEEHKAKLSANTKGRPKSEEHKAKIAASLRAKRQVPQT